MLINLQKHSKVRQTNIERCKEKGVILPTFEQMINPDKIPQEIKDKLSNTGLWDVDPVNLFRINWHNEPKEFGGQFGGVNYIEIPSQITGTKAHVYALAGKWFPCGVHKVGATYSCLAPALVTGNFDAINQQAVWPSTGNYCRGGAYNSALLGCKSIAILPAEMSQERFNWLKTVAGEIIATPGCESNVKEIFDKCHELDETRGNHIVIFNQFEQFENYLWHYEVTGGASTPLLLIRSFWTYSLFALSLFVFLQWEYMIRKHPERFTPFTNKKLQCGSCKYDCRFNKMKHLKSKNYINK